MKSLSGRAMKLPLVAVTASLLWSSLAAAQTPSSAGFAHWGYAAAPQFAPVAPQPLIPQEMPSFASQPAAPCLGGESYSLLIFTSQTTPKVPRATHTWAVLVRHSGGQVVDVQTISWMPHDLRIKPYDLTVEPGRNMTLQDTIDWVHGQSPQQMTLWPPLDASPELAARFYKQKAFLESDAIGYQCLDFVGEAGVRGNGSNCVHAITPMHDRGVGDVAQVYGDASGHYIVQAMQRRGLAAPLSCDPAWLVSSLGLDGLPMRRR